MKDETNLCRLCPFYGAKARPASYYYRHPDKNIQKAVCSECRLRLLKFYASEALFAEIR